MMGAYKTDIGKLAYVGKQGVLCLLSESIYAEKQGHTSPNNRVSSFIGDVLHRNENRIIATIIIFIFRFFFNMWSDCCFNLDFWPFSFGGHISYFFSQI